MQTITTEAISIRPCIAVRERIKVERGVSYQTDSISESRYEDGSEDKSWRTHRHYKNRSEAKEADRTYAAMRHRLHKVCISTELGLICPYSKRMELLAAIEECKTLAKQFNQQAKHCYITFRVLLTDVNADNQDGRDILRDTLKDSADKITAALKDFDIKSARKALYDTKNLVEAFSSPDTREKLRSAREEASALCTEINELVKAYSSVLNAQESPEGHALQRRIEVGFDWL